MTASRLIPQAPGFLSLVTLTFLVGWPFVSFLASNKTEAVTLSDVLLPWAAYQTLIVATILVLSKILKKISINRLCIVLGFLGAAFFSFGIVAHLSMFAGIHRGTIWLSVWLIMFCLTGWLSWTFSRKPFAAIVKKSVQKLAPHITPLRTTKHSPVELLPFLE